MSIIIEHQESWRLPDWVPELPSRPAWFVSCTDHPDLGNNNDGSPWGYATEGTARSVKIRHARAKHAGAAVAACVVRGEAS